MVEDIQSRAIHIMLIERILTVTGGPKKMLWAAHNADVSFGFALCIGRRHARTKEGCPSIKKTTRPKTWLGVDSEWISTSGTSGRGGGGGVKVVGRGSISADCPGLSCPASDKGATLCGSWSPACCGVLQRWTVVRSLLFRRMMDWSPVGLEAVTLVWPGHS